MLTNQLRKGMRVRLRNGWYATIADNKKGNIRLADVEGHFREIGSVYAHDIMTYHVISSNGDDMLSFPVEHTPAQIKLRKQVEAFYA